MKVAIVHEWFIDWAGSERVVEQILACYPGADLFALIDFLPDCHRKKLFGKRAKTTFLQRLPFVRRRHAYYLPWMPFAIEQLDVSAYDLVISSSHAVAKGVLTGPNQLHISYVHSPMRYAWDLQHEYLRDARGRGLRGWALRWVLHYLRQWDSRTPHGVDEFIANSAFVAQRIAKTYGRSAKVIFPPVDLDAFQLCERREPKYLCAGRLEPYKRIDLAIDAFATMPSRKLVVVGDGPELKSLRRRAPSNVEFVGHCAQQDWIRHLQSARALIFPGIEDFGITPVEAQACGTPVIAFGKGGALETIRPLGEDRASGLFFFEQTAQALAEAVDRFEKHVADFRPDACRANAERFGVPRFLEEFKAFVATALERRSVG